MSNGWTVIKQPCLCDTKPYSTQPLKEVARSNDQPVGWMHCLLDELNSSETGTYAGRIGCPWEDLYSACSASAVASAGAEG